jgi:cytochrome c oxidase accessory protein FixG
MTIDRPAMNITATPDLYQYDEEFRDSIATVDEKGKRIWVYAKKPKGRLYNWRIAVTVILLSILFAGPFVRIDGQPFLLLNIFERHFVIFGHAFWPQDFVLLAVTLITFFVFMILFTVVFGRIWCGWMCPQTLFMEMVFRKIEYLIEGDANEQRKLNKEPLSFKKGMKKTVKHVLFFAIALLIGHTAMAYLLGPEKTWAIMRQNPSSNIAGFSGLTGFTLIFYGVFAWFREQVCVAVCPYGRLQGVLLVKESIVVAYDWIRGEPRGKMKKSAPAMEVNKGDCIDCKLCVHVCPTGIDIRNGTQLECVNCTACIDACDEVMLKIDKPKGLIRYASFNSIQNGVQKLFTARVAGYSVILVALIVSLGFMVLTRSDVETTILKVPGTLFQKSEDGSITNLYNVEFVNKTFDELPLDLKVLSPEFATLRKPDAKSIVVPAEGLLKTIYFIEMPSDKITESKTTVTIGVFKNGEQVEKLKVKFIGPLKRKS